jgi:preprotein translocase subunit YajC
MFITPAFAQGASASVNDFLSFQSPIWMVLMVVGIMYFLVFRPQQQKVKAHRAMVKALRRGDTVVTNGGLVGKVTKVVDDDHIEIEISDGVKVRHLRASVSEVRAKGEPAKDNSAA